MMREKWHFAQVSHTMSQYSKCGKAKLSYNIRAVSLVTFVRILDSIPSLLFTFLLICPIHSLKLRVSSSQSHKYLNTETRSICLSFSLIWTSLNTAFFLLHDKGHNDRSRYGCVISNHSSLHYNIMDMILYV